MPVSVTKTVKATSPLTIEDLESFLTAAKDAPKDTVVTIREASYAKTSEVTLTYSLPSPDQAAIDAFSAEVKRRLSGSLPEPKDT